jgi:Mg-chelatase subunit ChlD
MQGNEEITRLRTTADGTVRFHPHAYAAGQGSFTFSAGSSEVTVDPGSVAQLVADAPAATDHVPLDLLFLNDATGSMGDEIDRLKSTVATVVERIEALPGQPDVRIGMTLFRDDGDTFVTGTYDFTTDIPEFQKALAAVQADGGGDTPEALDEGLDDALAKPSWRPAGTATQLVVLIGDAGGHPERQVDRPYTESMKDAAARGVKILPIAASSSDDQAEVAFRQIAQFTGGRFVFLSYGAEGAALGTSTDISKADYEELSLDDLVVRLVADELSARTGQPIAPPPAPSTTTTNPPGQ